MELFAKIPNINFLKLRKAAAIFSIILITFSIISLIFNGIKLGLDFTGGREIQLEFPNEITVTEIEEKLQKENISKSHIQISGEMNNVSITLSLDKDDNNHMDEKITDSTYRDKIENIFPQAKIVGSSYIGAKVSKDLTSQGIFAVLMALLITSFYIAIRFENKLALSAAISLLHDPIIILGIFALFKLQFDLASLAALLTVIGYSLNDTVVVFDRIRENLSKMQQKSVDDVVNLSINQILSRTILLSGFALIIVSVLFFFAGPSIRNFSLTLIIGILVGTYSSIYVAGSIAVSFGLTHRDLLSKKEKN